MPISYPILPRLSFVTVSSLAMKIYSKNAAKKFYFIRNNVSFCRLTKCLVVITVNNSVLFLKFLSSESLIQLLKSYIQDTYELLKTSFFMFERYLLIWYATNLQSMLSSLCELSIFKTFDLLPKNIDTDSSWRS